jgi:hypothetical protein
MTSERGADCGSCCTAQSTAFSTSSTRTGTAARCTKPRASSAQGIVPKRESGPCKSWIKVRNPNSAAYLRIVDGVALSKRSRVLKTTRLLL